MPPLPWSLFGLGVRRDELPSFDVIDIGRTHLHASGLFLEQERDAAVFVAPAAIKPLDALVSPRCREHAARNIAELLQLARCEPGTSGL